MFDTLLIITLFLQALLLVCLLTLRLSNLFFHSLPILADILKKALQLPFLFFFFSFSTVFLDRLPKVLSVYSYRLSLKTHVTNKGHFLMDTLKKNSVRKLPLAFICNACEPWRAIWFSLFIVTSTHSIRKTTRDRNSEIR